MIKCENRCVAISGSGIELLAECSSIVNSLKKTIVEKGISEFTAESSILGAVSIGLGEKKESPAKAKVNVENIKSNDCFLALLIAGILSGGLGNGKN